MARRKGRDNDNAGGVVPVPKRRRALPKPQPMCPCGKIAWYGPKGERARLRCYACRDKMTDAHATARICESAACVIVATFGPTGSGAAGATRCALHRTKEDIDVKTRRCEVAGCSTVPCFGLAGNEKSRAVRCAVHRLKDDIDVRSPACKVAECHKRPRFGPVGGRNAVRCVLHKLPDDVNRSNRTCELVGCHTQPSFGSARRGIALRCALHRTKDDVNVKTHTCEAAGCSTITSFGLAGGGKSGAVRCALHRTKDDVDVRSRTCEVAGCKTQPSFGPAGGGISGGVRCALHRSKDDIDVKSRTCEAVGCFKQPVFGPIGSGAAGAVRCCSHRTKDDVNVRKRICESMGCYTQPSFGPVGSGKTGAMRCAVHRFKDDVNVISPTCKAVGCSAIPCYGAVGSTKRLRCGVHRLDGDVAHTFHTCEACGCNTTSWCGFPGQKAMFCATHALVGHVPYPRRLCSVPRCRSLGTHALKSDAARVGGLRSLAASKRRWCDAHTSEAPGPTVDFVSRPCTACSLPDVLLPNGLCATCQPDPQTGKPPTRRLLLQRKVEFCLRARLTPELLALLASVDTVPDQLRGCTRRRPDLFFDCGTHAVVVEVDEEQHRCTASSASSGYTPECEQARMAEITQLLWQATGCADGYGVHWVWYNPSAYRPAAGVDGGRTEPTERRLALLLRVLRHALCASTAYVRAVGVAPADPRPSAAVTELFFDGWEPWHAGVATDFNTGDTRTVDVPDDGPADGDPTTADTTDTDSGEGDGTEEESSDSGDE